MSASGGSDSEPYATYFEPDECIEADYDSRIQGPDADSVILGIGLPLPLWPLSL